MTAAKDIKIHRIDDTLPLPAYHTEGAVAFDFYSRTELVVAPNIMEKVPTNLIIATPPGYALIIASRSSLFSKKGLLLANGIGVIDQDFAGATDEILLPILNLTAAPVKIERGERLAQGLFVPVAHANWIEEKPSVNSRGGFGTTGS